MTRRVLEVLLLGVLRRTDEEMALGPQPSLTALEIAGDPGALSPEVDLSAYRIVQEALTNGLEHAGPARARVVGALRARLPLGAA
jgi:signal transduction histidine kinase